MNSRPRWLLACSRMFILGVIPIPAGAALPPQAGSLHYFVDSLGGSDANPGTSEDLPWRTLAPVRSHAFLAGVFVNFMRGSAWTGGLTIDDSAASDLPIRFTAYGSGGRPLLRNPGGPDSWTRAIDIREDWVILEGVRVEDAHEAGVMISEGSEHVTIQDVEATNVGFGFAILGQHNLVTHNYAHDLR